MDADPGLDVGVSPDPEMDAEFQGLAYEFAFDQSAERMGYGQGGPAMLRLWRWHVAEKARAVRRAFREGFNAAAVVPEDAWCDTIEEDSWNASEAKASVTHA